MRLFHRIKLARRNTEWLVRGPCPMTRIGAEKLEHRNLVDRIPDDPNPLRLSTLDNVAAQPVAIHDPYPGLPHGPEALQLERQMGGELRPGGYVFILYFGKQQADLR